VTYDNIKQAQYMDTPAWLKLGFDVLRGIFGFLHRAIKGTKPEVILKRRQDLKRDIETHLHKRRDAYGTFGEAIIRDIDKMDYYLHDNPKKSYASYAWFRVEIKDISYRSLDCFISMPEEIVYDEKKSKWRFINKGEKGVNAYAVGKIPYENIINIDWNGDEYYPVPHIYCRYQNRSPYLAIHYYLKQGREPHEYFQQVEGFEPHKKRFSFF